MNRFTARLLLACAVAFVVWQLLDLPGPGLAVAVPLLAVQLAGALLFDLCYPLARAGRAPAAAGTPGPGPGPSGTPSVTVVVIATDEPEDMVLTALALAQAAGPVVLADLDGRHADTARDLGVACVADDVPQHALDRALGAVATDAVMAVRARSVVVPEAVRAAAAHLGEGVGWVTGHTHVYNDDAFSPHPDQPLQAVLRDGARRRGAAIWEQDATILRTSAARDAGGLDLARPAGGVLRGMARQGWQGALYDGNVAVTAAPEDAATFWRVRLDEQRAEVSDLADALRRRDTPARLACLAVLGHALRGWLAAVWLLAPAAVAATGASPTGRTPWLWALLLAALATFRWALSADLVANPLRPLRAGLASVYEMPGSLSATGALFHRHGTALGTTSRGTVVPARLLVWSALLVAAAAVLGVLERAGRVAVGSDGLQWWGVGASIAVVAVLVAAIVRSQALRRSGRSSYRFRLRLDAVLEPGGHAGGGPAYATRDLSAGGLRLRGPGPAPDNAAAVAGTVKMPGGETIRFKGHTTHARQDGERCEFGVRLDMPAPERAAWTRALFTTCAGGASLPAAGDPHATT